MEEIVAGLNLEQWWTNRAGLFAKNFVVSIEMHRAAQRGSGD